MRAHGIRVELDDGNDKLGYRMRNSQMRKIPYTLVIGNHEKEDGTVTYRKYGSQEQITIKVNDFIGLIDEENRFKK